MLVVQRNLGVVEVQAHVYLLLGKAVRDDDSRNTMHLLVDSTEWSTTEKLTKSSKRFHSGSEDV